MRVLKILSVFLAALIFTLVIDSLFGTQAAVIVAIIVTTAFTVIERMTLEGGR